jgi:LmbE family N-acetylglucosaminyl deacetylase
MSHIYLSPHLDDAALSCGGTIFRQTQAGQQVMVVNIFAGVPDYSRLSTFAREKHAVWGSPEDVVAARQAEDRAALTRLGAEAVYWDHLDAIYRLDGTRVLYPDEAGIFGAVDPADGALQDGLVAEVETLLDRARDAMCYVPLAIGHHVDHQLVRDVGLALADRGRRVRFYEDFPYVWWETTGGGEGDRVEGLSEQELTLRPTSPLPGCWKPVDQAIDVEPKIAAIACYPSQVSDLFGSEDAMAEAVRAYARSVGGDHYAERFWRDVRTK